MPALPGQAFLEPIAEQQRMDQLARSEPYRLAHEASLARLQNAEAATAEMRLGQERDFAARMAGIGGTPEERISKGIVTAFETGNLNAGVRMMQMQEQLSAHRATETWRQAQLQSAQTADRLRTLEAMGRGAEWVATQPEDQRAAAWDQYVGAMESMPGIKFPPNFRAYSPALLEAVRAQSMSGYQRAELEQKRIEERRKRDDDERKQRETDARIRELDARARADDARADRERRLEGKPAGRGTVPKVTDREAATYINTDPDLKDRPDEERKKWAFDVASEANALMRSNPAIDDPALAVARVIQEKKRRGDFPRPKPKDTRSLWEKYAPEALGGKPEPGEKKPEPTQADRDWVKAHPETRGDFVKHFGVEP